VNLFFTKVYLALSALLHGYDILFVGGECSVLKHLIIPGKDTEN